MQSIHFTGKLRNMASLYLTCGDEILLLYRQGSKVANNLWIGCAGGHFEPAELNDPYSCILREAQEELHLTPNMMQGLALRYIMVRRTPQEIRQNYYFFAQATKEYMDTLHSNEGILQRFPLADIDTLEMPFSAKHMLLHWRSAARHNTMLYTGTATGDTVVFTPLPAF